MTHLEIINNLIKTLEKYRDKEDYTSLGLEKGKFGCEEGCGDETLFHQIIILRELKVLFLEEVEKNKINVHF